MSNESETGIILHQIKLTDEMVDFLNGKDGGWTNASKKYEAVEAHLECGSINGADNWEPRFWKHYRAVAKIHTDKLEEAFGIGNAYGGAHMDMVEKGLLTPLLPLISFREGHETVDMHSMSVGDICEMDGKHYMCHRVGFTEIQITEHGFDMGGYSKLAEIWCLRMLRHQRRNPFEWKHATTTSLWPYNGL